MTISITDPVRNEQRNKVMAIWLFVIAAMVFAMVVIGGLTRLTHSGLSMVDWRPFTGWLPPLNESEWQLIFEQYKQFPEFNKKNPSMTLSGFKDIFWLEFIHRVWGRIIGLVFFVPFIIFALRGWINFSIFVRFAAIMMMGGGQGILGWYMVKSGLIDRPDVSQYRLAAHLILALLIYAYTFWIALTLWQNAGFSVMWSRLSILAASLVGLVFVTAFSGALVAGLDAGLTYNTFPLMDDSLLPDGMLSMQPLYINFFENITTVQFNHRSLAIITFSFTVGFWLYCRIMNVSQTFVVAMSCLVLVVIVQVALGILTLLWVVPVSLAALHQATAVILLSCAIWVLRESIVSKIDVK